METSPPLSMGTEAKRLLLRALTHTCLTALSLDLDRRKRIPFLSGSDLTS
jgi:hypothetical protein